MLRPGARRGAVVDWGSLDRPSLTREFITLLVVIGPIGTIPVYLYAAQGVPRRLHRRLALRAVAIDALVLLLFLAGGQQVLETLGLRLGSVQIGGGVIPFLFALTMVFGEPKAGREIEEAERDHMAGAVSPLAGRDAGRGDPDAQRERPPRPSRP